MCTKINLHSWRIYGSEFYTLACVIYYTHTPVSDNNYRGRDVSFESCAFMSDFIHDESFDFVLLIHTYIHRHAEVST